MFHFIFAPKKYIFTLQEFYKYSDVGSTGV